MAEGNAPVRSSTRGAGALLADRLDATARTFAEHLAIVHGDRRLTWSQVGDQSARIARALLARGIGRGDHIALWLPNHPDWLLIWLAAVRIGAAVVPVNTRYKADEAAYVIGKSDAGLLFIEDRFLGIDYLATVREIRARLPQLHEVVVLGKAPEDFVGYGTLLRGADQVSDARLTEAEAAVSPDALVIIVFTSGTTGFPKGVLHTHDVVRMADTVAHWLELHPGDRILGHLPLFHVSGVFSSFLLALMTGGALIQLDRWNAATALELIERERISVLSGIPTHFVDLLDSPDLQRRDVSSLRTGWIGGSYIPPEVVRGAREKLGMEALLPVYGMTETTSCTTLGRKTDPLEARVAGNGVSLGGYEVAVIDPDTRRPIATGAEGEIAVRGYTVMKGYYKEPEATAAVLGSDGWLCTGDLGAFDEEGYLRITGRRSDMFIVGGNNVHPADIEHVLLEHGGVKAAHVVPGPDPRMGEVAIAFVQAAKGEGFGEREMIDHARSRLASFKVPRRVVMMDEWPMTPTGKVELARLRELAADLP